MARRFPSACAKSACAALASAALLSGCFGGNAPVPVLLAESFPPQGVAFRRYEPPQFPYQLRPTGVTSGYCVMALTIDAAGRVEDAVAIEATDDAFVAAVLEVVPEWIFADAGASDTEPRREIMHFQFRRSGVVSQLSHREGAQSMFVESDDRFARIRLVAWDELDAPPARIDDGLHRRTAIFAGAADVSFVIDTEGRVRVPVVTRASDPVLGAAALDAIAEWRFTPPRRHGESVLVEVRARLGASPHAESSDE